MFRPALLHACLKQVEQVVTVVTRLILQGNFCHHHCHHLVGGDAQFAPRAFQGLSKCHTDAEARIRARNF